MNDDDNRDAEDAALNARLDKLRETLRARDEERLAQEAPASERQGFGRAMSVGLNAFSEFVGAVVVGALIGWQADVWLGTKPWLLVVFLGLGTATGFWNLYRVAAAKNAEKSEG
jgi:ATP synthase protein I